MTADNRYSGIPLEQIEQEFPSLGKNLVDMKSGAENSLLFSLTTEMTQEWNKDWDNQTNQVFGLQSFTVRPEFVAENKYLLTDVYVRHAITNAIYHVGIHWDQEAIRNGNGALSVDAGLQKMFGFDRNKAISVTAPTSARRMAVYYKMQ